MKYTYTLANDNIVVSIITTDPDISKALEIKVRIDIKILWFKLHKEFIVNSLTLTKLVD